MSKASELVEILREDVNLYIKDLCGLHALEAINLIEHQAHTIERLKGLVGQWLLAYESGEDTQLDLCAWQTRKAVEGE